MSAEFRSDHFTLHALADGVFAAIATEDGAGFSNAGLIDLGERTLVFDAFENPQAAEDLLKAALQYTGRHPDVVIVSHFHPDHWGGLQVFAACPILATHVTRQMMAPIAEEIVRAKQNLSDMEKDLQNAEAQLSAETDAIKRHALQVSVTRQRHTLQAMPIIRPTLPDQTFDGKIVFHGNRRGVELIATGKGHTESDCILHLPQDKVTFIGDLGFFQSAPFMPYGFPPEWIELLEDMATWDVTTFVPGHGPLGTKADLDLEVRYIQTLEAMVASIVQAGGTVDDALGQILPPPFDAWQASMRRRFEANVCGSFKRHAGQ